MNYYDVCCRYRGRHVHITEKNGRRHFGKIVDVDNRFVYIETKRTHADLGGFGYGYYGGYYGGYYNPYVVPVALAAIGGFALGAAFLW